MVHEVLEAGRECIQCIRELQKSAEDQGILDASVRMPAVFMEPEDQRTIRILQSMFLEPPCGILTFWAPSFGTQSSLATSMKLGTPER